ncbi:alpha/beta fold hydrolase [Nitriliruptor alkaliphilus]|uniref:alpha/beta fold hydrolase n=1 Tax=Nitriliruptor alkaliphilus TaxID=427918 RepID=UPI0012EE0076|nr:alpha/beta fold hydrolase [Nitriliruptor alkaliphilus]
MPLARALPVLALVAIAAGGPLLVPSIPAPGTSPARALGDDDSRFASLAGVEVHHKVAGDRGDPAVVLLHHFYGNVSTWRHVQRALSDRFHVAAFDRPAFGLTQRPPREAWNGTNPYTRATSARITVELLDRLEVDQAVLVGSSAGGTSALETYARSPERVRALVLVSPAITGDVGPPSWLRPALRTPQLRRIGPRIVRRAAGEVTVERVAGSWFDPSRATEEDVAAYTRPLQVDGWDVGYWELFAADPPPNLSALLPRIDVPTLVVSGDSDPVIAPRFSRRTAQAIPGAEYVELKRCGHTPQEECPEAFEAVVRDFLDGLPG